jgi:DNA polymerase-3 subunit delta
MAILKASALEPHLIRNQLSPAYLIYGPDVGKVGEVARALVRHVAGSLDDPFAVEHLQEEAIAADPQRLSDEVFSRPMLGTRKAIWIGSAGNSFAQAYERLGKLPSDGNVIVAEAGNLPKSSKLRSLFEKSPQAQVIPCYEDDAKDLDRLVDAAFAEAGLHLAPDAKGALLNYLGENRALSRAEIDKLILYCHGSDAVSLADVEAVCSGKTTAGINELTDAVFNGDMAATGSIADRQLKSGTPGSRLLSVAALHVPLLEKMVLDVEAGVPPAQAVKMAQPPIFFPRQDTIVQQSKIWDAAALSSAAQSLFLAILQTREFPALEDQIAERSLLSLARLAAGRRFRT